MRAASMGHRATFGVTIGSVKTIDAVSPQQISGETTAVKIQKKERCYAVTIAVN